MMSIYAGDYTLGATRTVVISGTGRDNTLVYSSEAWFRERIALALDANLIAYTAVRATKTGDNVIFEIEVVALGEHSNEDVRRLVQIALQNAVYIYSPQALCSAAGPLGAALCPDQTRFVMTNVQTRVLSGDDRTLPVAKSPYQPPAAGSGTSGDNRGGSSSRSTDSFAASLGLVTPAEIALLAIVAVIAVKVLR
ncbi:MAG: hypothetical protein KF736_09920 [Acidobacteria bacterium]|nr:hypothetical protein [Acidobacteriota bacterium]MCW5949826.1 hypothetical protein [Pyrinomonadaceae bacterium]